MTVKKREISTELLKKYESLLEYLRAQKRIAVAFSSGVDSTFLLFAAKEALGKDMIAVTASLHSFPENDLKESKAFCKSLGVNQVICEMNELEVEGFAENPKNRCYICKKAIFSNFLRTAEKLGMDVVAEGSNMDDLKDYRPGHQAIAELHIKSPLRACGFTKSEIRELSRYFNLPTWNKPSFACLSSRIPYGEEITEEKLARVEKGEDLLRTLGFSQYRVRVHGNIARIELLVQDFDRFMEEKTRHAVYEKFREYGFTYVALDLMGFRSGSLNEVLK